jgi:hypothetical protein
MKNIDQFKKENPNIKIENRTINIFNNKNTSIEKREQHIITGLKGNEKLELIIEKDGDFDILNEILKIEPIFFGDFLAIHYENTVEILLSQVSGKSIYSNDDNDEDYTFYKATLDYYYNNLDITLQISEHDNFLPYLYSYIKGRTRIYRRQKLVMKIENFITPTNEGIESDIRNIVNSVLFDFEYNHGIAFETISSEGIARINFRKNRKYLPLPKEKIHLVFKKYIPELIQYFHIAENVDYLPFKYICYYHILEYMSDKSAYSVVADEIKKIMLQPDFHHKTNKYVSNAVAIFKKETEKHSGDKYKIERVLKQFINRNEIIEGLDEIEIRAFFEKERNLDCKKPLKLSAINFEDDNNFFSGITKRIYALRCSIVHSNPDFDETKAIPFVPTPRNLESLRLDIELIALIARKIIVETKE